MEQRGKRPLPERDERRDDRGHERQAEPGGHDPASGRRTPEPEHDRDDCQAMVAMATRTPARSARPIGARPATAEMRHQSRRVANGEGDCGRIHERRSGPRWRPEIETIRAAAASISRARRDVPELLRVAHADRHAKRSRVEPARHERHCSERHIHDGEGGQNGGQQAQPSRHLARGQQLPENPVAAAEASEGPRAPGDPVIEDVLVHPETEPAAAHAIRTPGAIRSAARCRRPGTSQCPPALSSRLPRSRSGSRGRATAGRQ